MKRVLAVLGRGARRLAVAERLDRDLPDARIWVWPPAPPSLYPGFSSPAFDDEDDLARGVAAWAEAAALTGAFVVDERLLFRGVADILAARGVAVLGASRATSRIEADKLWAKERLRDAGVSTADSIEVGDVPGLREAGRRLGYPLHLKRAPSLGAKGVVAVRDPSELEAAWIAIHRRGPKPTRLFAERFVPGTEITVTAVVSPARIALLPPVEVFPRRTLAPDSALTGGMGARTSPAPRLAQDVLEQGLEPLLHALDRLGTSRYTGALSLNLRGIDDWIALEVNCHFGDPETQCMLAAAADGLADLLADDWSCRAERELHVADPADSPQTTVVVAHRSYPGGTYEPIAYRAQDVLALDASFHPYASAEDASSIRSTSGRFGSLTGPHPDPPDTRLHEAVERVAALHPDLSYRSDILAAVSRGSVTWAAR